VLLVLSAVMIQGFCVRENIEYYSPDVVGGDSTESVPCQTYGYLPSRNASSHNGRYQITPLGESGTEVWTTCCPPRVVMQQRSVRPAVEHATSSSQLPRQSLSYTSLSKFQDFWIN